MAKPTEEGVGTAPNHASPGALTEKTSSSSFPIVGMGASAGGLEAFTAFFRAMLSDSGMAFVLVQHLDPTRESLMSDLLASETAMPVVQVTQPTEVKPNCVYLIPPNAYLNVRKGVLYVSEPDEPRGKRRPIDVFFRSLAEDQQQKAIVVVLSGTGTNGAAGLKDVKACGGMIMAQDPSTARHDGMPRSAIATGLVDYILPVERMPEALLEYIHHSYVESQNPDQTATVLGETAAEQFEAILTLLRSRQDFDFRYYKKGTLMRRIHRRMGLNHIQNGADYLIYLRQHPVEMEALARDLMISVTHFFRDPQAWAYLEQHILPQLLAHRHDQTPLRVWVPGCATGEEVYSLAMLLTEQLQAQHKTVPLQFFASDLNRDALAFARAGHYPDGIAADLSAARLQRFFHFEDHYYRVTKELRDLVTFAVQNLISDPPFGRLDLISCRNLLIYLEPEVQERVISLFHFALKPDGYLFLGNAETIGPQAELFETASKKWRIYRRSGSSRADRIALPATPLRAQSRGSIDLRPLSAPVLAVPGRLAGIAQQIVLERHTKACALINRNYEILYLFGPSADYLIQPTGEMTLDLLAWAREGLRTKLRAVLHSAMRSGEPATASDIPLKRGKQSYRVSCTAEPLSSPPEAEGLLLVVFEDQQQAGGGEETLPAKPGPADESVLSQLEYELKLTKDELRSTLEQLESSNEEFKATNEEVMSINEELQSTNEELETSKEELQSVNEELITSNQQLESKNLELEATNDDLKNLLVSTQIATLFLDRQLRIRRFTPTMTQLMRLIATDVGRSIEDITSKFSNEGLLQDAAQVLEQLTALETEVQTDDRRWYLRRTLPYRTEDNRIDGVVMTFIETTEHKLAESRQRFLVEFYDAIRALEEPEDIIATAARITGSYFKVNRCAYGIIDERQTQLSIERDYCDAEASGQAGRISLESWDPAILKELKSARTVAIEDIRADPRTAEPAAFGVSPDTRALLMVPLIKAGRIVALLILSHREPRAWPAAEVALLHQVADRTWLAVEKARSDKALRLGEERFRIALQGSSIMVFNQDRALRYTWVHNPAIFSARPLLGKSDREIVERPEDADALEALKQRVLNTGQSEHQTVSVWRDGQQSWYDLNLEPLRNETGQPMGLIGAAIDLSERMRLETQLRQQAEQLAIADRHKNAFLAMLGHELRNPLAPIRNVISTLKTRDRQGSLTTESLRLSIDMIDRQLSQLIHLVNDLLDVARITQDRIVLRKQAVALGDIVRQAEEMVKPKIEERRQRLTVTPPPADLSVEADPERLTQVIGNLLDNASKYTPEEGRIGLAVSLEEDQVLVRVQDTGQGIPADQLSHIFDMFFQAQCEAGCAQGGLGLGLTLVKRLVEMHGGQVQAKSAGPGQGSEFSVRLPLSPGTPALAATRHPTDPAEVNRPSLRILVIDDNPDVADSLAILLKAMGHTVKTAGNGRTALETAQVFQPDVVLLDIGLPDMNGHEVARRLREAYPSQKRLLIALSGYAEEQDRRQTREAGFDHYMLKPGNHEELASLLGSFTRSGPP